VGLVTWALLRAFVRRYQQSWGELSIAAARAATWAIEQGLSANLDMTWQQRDASACLWRKVRELHLVQVQVCDDAIAALMSGADVIAAHGGRTPPVAGCPCVTCSPSRAA
jgi:hypothetical protein